MSDQEAETMLSLLLQLGPPQPLNNCHWKDMATGKKAITQMKRCVDCKARARAAQYMLDHAILIDAKYYAGSQDGVMWSWAKR